MPRPGYRDPQRGIVTACATLNVICFDTGQSSIAITAWTPDGFKVKTWYLGEVPTSGLLTPPALEALQAGAQRAIDAWFAGEL